MENEEILIKRQLSDFCRTAEQMSKPTCCVICGKEQSSFKNSHSVPRFVLKRIAQGGKVKTFNDIVGMHNSKNGVNNSWVFHSICSECENKYFSTYEDEKALLKEPSNRIMAEIALKNVLLMHSKYRRDKETDKMSIEMGTFVGETDVLSIMNQLDIENMEFEIKRSKKIIDKKLKSGFHLMYYKILDWVVPVAFQSALCVYYNIDGTIINQIYSEDKNIRMQQLHIAVFPLKEQTVVMAFYHKDDRNYVSFERQFFRLSEEKRLEYINYLMFKYTEHTLFSPIVKPEALKNKYLIDLCEEDGNNLFGYGQCVLPSDIPNFLAEDLKIR